MIQSLKEKIQSISTSKTPLSRYVSIAESLQFQFPTSVAYHKSPVAWNLTVTIDQLRDSLVNAEGREILQRLSDLAANENSEGAHSYIDFFIHKQLPGCSRHIVHPRPLVIVAHGEIVHWQEISLKKDLLSYVNKISFLGERDRLLYLDAIHRDILLNEITQEDTFSLDSQQDIVENHILVGPSARSNDITKITAAELKQKKDRILNKEIKGIDFDILFIQNGTTDLRSILAAFHAINVSIPDIRIVCCRADSFSDRRQEFEYHTKNPLHEQLEQRRFKNPEYYRLKLSELDSLYVMIKGFEKEFPKLEKPSFWLRHSDKYRSMKLSKELYIKKYLAVFQELKKIKEQNPHLPNLLNEKAENYIELFQKYKEIFLQERD